MATTTASCGLRHRNAPRKAQSDDWVGRLPVPIPRLLRLFPNGNGIAIPSPRSKVSWSETTKVEGMKLVLLVIGPAIVVTILVKVAIAIIKVWREPIL